MLRIDQSGFPGYVAVGEIVLCGRLAKLVGLLFGGVIGTRLGCPEGRFPGFAFLVDAAYELPEVRGVVGLEGAFALVRELVPLQGRHSSRALEREADNHGVLVAHGRLNRERVVPDGHLCLFRGGVWPKQLLRCVYVGLDVFPGWIRHHHGIAVLVSLHLVVGLHAFAGIASERAGEEVGIAGDGPGAYGHDHQGCGSSDCDGSPLEVGRGGA